MLNQLYVAFVKNRKRIGSTLLAMIASSLAFPQVRERPNLVLALTVLGVGIRQAGANKSDEFYEDHPVEPPLK